MAIEPWKMEELDHDKFKWSTFSDEKHPLKPDDADPLVLKTISATLETLYMEAVAKVKGTTYQEWANYCGLKDKDAPTKRWIPHPERMSRDKVLKTCEYFGGKLGCLITVDYLRDPLITRDSTEDIWSAKLVQSAYGRLSKHHQRLITSMLKEFLTSEMIETDYRFLQSAHDSMSNVKHS